MDNHKLVMILINWFLYFSKYDKKEIFIFYIKYAWNYLEFGHMHTNKNIYIFYFLNKEFWIFLCFFLKFWRKTGIFDTWSVSYNVSLQSKYQMKWLKKTCKRQNGP
jgi:hypothetical protein